MDYFQLISLNLPGGTEETANKSQDNMYKG